MTPGRNPSINASAHGGEPVVAGLASERAANDRVALEIGPVDIALDAQNPLAHLPVVTSCAADHAPRHIEPGGVGPGGMAPTAAAIDPEIEPRPVVEGECRRLLYVWVVAALQIGGPTWPHQRGQRQHPHTRKKYTSHCPISHCFVSSQYSKMQKRLVQ
jgi:hypothetical protein